MDAKDQSPASGPVAVERRDDLAIVTISNPGKLNAMSVAMRDGLTETFRGLNDDTSCRAIVLTGADDHFSAGADLGGWNETEVRQCRVRLKRGASPLLMREMIAGAKPIVAAVEGYAYGAGLALAAASDLRAFKGLAAARAGTRAGLRSAVAVLHRFLEALVS